MKRWEVLVQGRNSHYWTKEMIYPVQATTPEVAVYRASKLYRAWLPRGTRLNALTLKVTRAKGGS